MLLVFSGVFTFLVGKLSAILSIVCTLVPDLASLDAYPLYAASALAANSFARSSFAAAFPLFGVQSKFEHGYTRVVEHVWLIAADG